MDFIQEIVQELDKNKAENIQTLDVKKISTFCETMIMATATSQRHARALANYLHIKAKELGHAVLGEEGKADSDWVLVDLDEVVVHIMTADARRMYQLEKLWSTAPANRSQSVEEEPAPV